jgi:signal transduction histidine kinase
MRILMKEMSSLWERLGDLKKVNVAELSAQTKRLETVLASVDDAILELDNQGNVFHCSDTLLKILKLDSSDVVGHPWSDLPTLNENYLKLRSTLSPTMEDGVTLEISIPNSESHGDQKRLYSGRHRAITTKDEISIGEVFLLHDITESRQRDHLKSEFIGMLSTELKAPFQSLQVAADQLNTHKDLVPNELKPFLDTVMDDVSKINAVANDFMQVGMSDSYALKLKISRQPISQLLEELLKHFTVLARGRKVKLEYDRQGKDVIWANIDIAKFPCAVSNLLSNAIRISKPGQKVTMRVVDRVSTEFFYIDIMDEGPGITEDVQQKMFEPYYQAPNLTSGTSTGFLGLSLTIAKEIVEAHDGHIEYFLNKPQGSVFRIKLPLVLSPTQTG